MQKSYITAIKDAQSTLLKNYKNVLIYGLGVTDPKGIFGSTLGLQAEFGSERVFDTPLSENALTGVSIGLSLAGFKPIFIHQRFDFFLLAMDQLVNSAAKWHMMYGGQSSASIVIRLIVGRGWGQGPTHAQSLHSWLAHIPGLKIVMPFTPHDAKGLLISSVLDPNPVIFIEHRWLHQTEGDVPDGEYGVEIGKAAILREGRDITLVSTSLMVAEALKSADILEKDFGISAEVIDLRSIKPIDWETILNSVKKTGGVIAIDISHSFVSLASEIVAHVSQYLHSYLRFKPMTICLPDKSVPTSHFLTADYYPDSFTIISSVCELLGVEERTLLSKGKNVQKDVPGEWFKGPF